MSEGLIEETVSGLGGKLQCYPLQIQNGITNRYNLIPIQVVRFALSSCDTCDPWASSAIQMNLLCLPAYI